MFCCECIRDPLRNLRTQPARSPGSSASGTANSDSSSSRARGRSGTASSAPRQTLDTSSGSSKTAGASEEQRVRQWQMAIFQYEQAEFSLLVKGQGQVTQAVLLQVRQDPASFQAHPNDALRALAAKWTALCLMEKDLHSRKEMEERDSDDEDEDAQVHEEVFRDDSKEAAEENAAEGVGFFTERLSMIYTSRLHTIDRTQGVLVPRANPRLASTVGSAGVLVRPRWPDSLPDLFVDVIKLNGYGRRMQRTLQLTSSHVLNLKPRAAPAPSPAGPSGSSSAQPTAPSLPSHHAHHTQGSSASGSGSVLVSKGYHYLDIARVYTGGPGGSVVFVELRSGKRTGYIASSAPYLSQQLLSRILTRRQLDRGVAGGAVGGGGFVFTASSAAAHLASISQASSSGAHEILGIFAVSLRERLQRAMAIPAGAAGAEEEGISPLHAAGPAGDGGDEQKPIAAPEEAQEEGEGLGGQQVDEDADCVFPHVDGAAAAVDEGQEALVVEEGREGAEEKHEGGRGEEPAGGGDVVSSPLHPAQELPAGTEPRGAEGQEEEAASAASSAPGAAQPAQSSPSSLPSPAAAHASPSSSFSLSPAAASAEFAVMAQVRRLLGDATAPEGYTFKLFRERWEKDAASVHSAGSGGREKALAATKLLRDLRHVVEGLHEHLTLSRAFSLDMLLAQARQRLMARKSLVTDSPNNSSDAAVRFQRRQSLKLLQDEHRLTASDVSEESLTLLSFAVFAVV
eukprot:gene33539-40574_t